MHLSEIKVEILYYSALTDLVYGINLVQMVTDEAINVLCQ